MNEQHDAPKSTGKKGRQKIRDLVMLFPRLTLESNYPRRPLYRTLEPNEPLYALAAWAHHHADELDHDTRQGFFLALSRAWPTTRGRKKRADQRTYFVWLCAAGVPIEELAQTWHLAPQHVRDVIRDHLTSIRELAGAEEAWHVEVDEQEGDLPPVPFDPGTMIGAALTFPDPGSDADAEYADEIARRRDFPSAAHMFAARWPTIWRADGDAGAGTEFTVTLEQAS